MDWRFLARKESEDLSLPSGETSEASYSLTSVEASEIVASQLLSYKPRHEVNEIEACNMTARNTEQEMFEASIASAYGAQGFVSSPDLLAYKPRSSRVEIQVTKRSMTEGKHRYSAETNTRRSKKGKGVHFDENVVVHEIQPVPTKLWFSSRELAKIRSRNDLQLQHFHHKKDLDPSIEDLHSIRGLVEEVSFYDSFLQDSQLYVLEHQHGESVACIYSNMSTEAYWEARKRAIEDARYVEEWMKVNRPTLLYV